MNFQNCDAYYNNNTKNMKMPSPAYSPGMLLRFKTTYSGSSCCMP